MNKNGSVLDLIYVVCAILFVTIVFIVAYHFGSSITSSALGEGSTEGTAMLDRMDTGLLPVFDYLVVAIVFGSFLSLLVAGYFLRSSPVFFVIAFFIIILNLILAVVFNRVWETITSVETLSTTVAAFPMTNFIFSNFPIIVVGMGFLISIVVYGLSRSGGDQLGI